MVRRGSFLAQFEGIVMVRKLSIVGVAGVLLLVGSGLRMAFAGNNITQPETLILTERTLKDRFVDVGKSGFSPGDTYFFVDSLIYPPNGSRVGTVRGMCTRQIGQWQTCQVGGFIDGRGEIFASGVSKNSQQPMVVDYAVTGGTGEFANVRGTVHVAPISDNVETITLKLIP